MKKTFNQKGITLIALVVTIVVLLILAATSISMLVGENGIIKKADDAKENTRGGDVKETVEMAANENKLIDYTNGIENKKSKQDVIDELSADGKLTEDEIEKLKTEDIITIGDIEIDFGVIENGENVEIDLSGKNFIWIGDSLMRGINENLDNAFPEYFARLTNANCLNVSASGAKINDDVNNNLMQQVDELISQSTGNEQVDFIVLNGGGNDIFNSDGKEIGTVDMSTNEVTQGDTLISNFEEVIKKLKENAPNVPIMYLNAYNIDLEAIEMLVYTDVKTYYELSYINNLLGTNATSFEEIKDKIIQVLTEGDSSKGIEPKITNVKNNGEELIQQIKNACNKWDIEYCDISNYISIEENEHYQSDYMHFNSNGYTELTPYIVEKVKEILF